ncbi:HK97-gp10 family putative phage morphogenesis protein [Hymenobacter mucosus]|uniref:Phage protein, HK97 gp10 family n=1 Tax=Hymenobacter mucosus TaxID=1411120 RepID=A0A239AAC1_9BACT|nr:HK97-gp10 family putative phage morphogenesis protein [Hymenobacter mucosus]SNR92352.1 phage protein, HK97 gp10 family [Hymenobacter mucosus]
MAGINIKVSGVDRLIQKLRFYQVDKKARVKAVVGKYLLLIESEAKRRAPVDTGRLRASIYADPTPDGLGGRVAVQAEYAMYVELGTRLIQAQPFLFPAAEALRPAYTTDIIAALRTR